MIVPEYTHNGALCPRLQYLFLILTRPHGDMHSGHRRYKAGPFAATNQENSKLNRSLSSLSFFE